MKKKVDIPPNGKYCWMYFEFDRLEICSKDVIEYSNSVKGITVDLDEKFLKYLFLRKLKIDSFCCEEFEINYVPIENKKELLDFLQIVTSCVKKIEYIYDDDFEEEIPQKRISKEEFIRRFEELNEEI